jgi:hypothetical protein
MAFVQTYEPISKGTLHLGPSSYWLAGRSHEEPSNDPWGLRSDSQPRQAPAVALSFAAAHAQAVCELRDGSCSMQVACRVVELMRGPGPSSADDFVRVFETRSRLLSERASASAPLRARSMRAPEYAPVNLLLRRDGGRDAHDRLVTLREAPKAEAAPVASVAEAPRSLSALTAHLMSERKLGYAEAFAEASRTLRGQTSG